MALPHPLPRPPHLPPRPPPVHLTVERGPLPLGPRPPPGPPAAARPGAPGHQLAPPARHAHLSQRVKLRGQTATVPSVGVRCDRSVDSVPPLLHSVSCWAARFPGRVTSPLFLQTLQEEEEAGEEFCRSRASSTASRGSHGAGSLRRRAGPRGRPGSGYLSPRLESGGAAALVWYDWFPPHTDPEPLAVSRLEELFLAAGGARCGGAGRLVSPLLLSNTHPQYRLAQSPAY